MSNYIRWYISRLQTHPWSTNLASAAVLMAGGDVLAQRLEIRHLPDQEPPKLQRTLSYRRYGALSPDVEGLQHQLHEQSRRQSAQRETSLLAGDLWLAQADIWQTFSKQVASIDLFRTFSMVVWAVTAYTPFYMGLYRSFDRRWPVNTPSTIAMRVATVFIGSIGLNAAFFGYGTLVHHASEWYTAQPQPQAKVPFDWPMAVEEIRRKVSTELPPTVVDSARIWIPLNILQFSLLPAFVRPLVLSTASLFWNCYLSLAQHRDA